MKKKIISLFLTTMMLSVLGGCGATTESDSSSNDTQQTSQEEGVVIEDISYLMIYNPYIYNEMDENGYPDAKSLYTGDFSSQIMTGMNRADDFGMELEMPVMVTQKELEEGIDFTGINRDGIRAGAMDPSYNLYDTHEFYHYNETLEYSVLEEFTCVYVGEHCYIWSLNGSISEEDARMMGEDFDNDIYAKNLESFGIPRFTDNGGKVNLLYYPMQLGIGGCFTTKDIFSSAEVPEEYVTTYGFNTDHAIIHLNCDYIEMELSFAKSTMSHELQHLICATESLYYSETPFIKTWLNEAMSAYAEEIIYPGIKEQNGYSSLFYLSDLFRKGQSLYNFDTTDDEYIGAYGVVYLFTEYLVESEKEDVYFDVHSFWKNAYRNDVTEAQALRDIASEEFYDEINNKYNYSEFVKSKFSSEEDEWLSKLTLDFYIETLSMDLANLHEYEDDVHATMLYGEVEPLEIEGGGRVIIALKNGSYEIPEDADDEFVYVGLNEAFEPVLIYY